MKVIYSIGNSSIESSPDIDQFIFLSKLVEIVVVEMTKTEEREIQLIADNGEKKTAVWFEKRPRIVDDGIETLKDYVMSRCRAIIVSSNHKE